MKNKQLVNQRNGYIVSTQIEYADTWLSRLVGLLADSSLKKHEALWLSPCKSVHTIGMRFSIDVVFLDKYNRIKKLGESVKPFRFCKAAKGTHSVLELPSGIIQSAGLQRGDKLLLQ